MFLASALIPILAPSFPKPSSKESFSTASMGDDGGLACAPACLPRFPRAFGAPSEHSQRCRQLFPLSFPWDEYPLMPVSCLAPCPKSAPRERCNVDSFALSIRLTLLKRKSAQFYYYRASGLFPNRLRSLFQPWRTPPPRVWALVLLFLLAVLQYTQGLDQFLQTQLLL